MKRKKYKYREITGICKKTGQKCKTMEVTKWKGFIAGFMPEYEPVETKHIGCSCKAYMVCHKKRNVVYVNQFDTWEGFN